MTLNDDLDEYFKDEIGAGNLAAIIGILMIIVVVSLIIIF